MKTQLTTILTSAILFLGLQGCANSAMSEQSKQTLQTTQGYKVGTIKVTLGKGSFLDYSKENKLYPSEKTLSQYFKHDITKYLKQNGKACQPKQACTTIDMNVNYIRKFNLKSVTVSAPTIDRTIILKKGDKVLYTNTQNGLKPIRGGLLGNAMNELSVFTKAGESKPNREDERKDIDAISKITVQDILKVGQ